MQMYSSTSSSVVQNVKDEISRWSLQGTYPDCGSLRKWSYSINPIPDDQLESHDWSGILEYLYRVLENTAAYSATRGPDRWEYLLCLLKLLDKLDKSWIERSVSGHVPLGVRKGEAGMQLLFAVQQSTCLQRASIMDTLSEQLTELFRLQRTAVHMIPRLFRNDNEWLWAIVHVIQEDSQPLDVVNAFVKIVIQAYMTAQQLMNQRQLTLSPANITALTGICSLIWELYPDNNPYFNADVGRSYEEPEMSSISYANMPSQDTHTANPYSTSAHVSTGPSYSEQRELLHQLQQQSTAYVPPAVNRQFQFGFNPQTAVSGGSSQGTHTRVYDHPTYSGLSMPHTPSNYHAPSTIHYTTSASMLAHNTYAYERAGNWQYLQHLHLSHVPAGPELVDEECGDNIEILRLGGVARGVQDQVQGRGRGAPLPANAGLCRVETGSVPPPLPVRSERFSAYHSSATQSQHVTIRPGSTAASFGGQPASAHTHPVSPASLVPPMLSAPPGHLPRLPDAAMQLLRRPQRSGVDWHSHRPADVAETPFARSTDQIQQNVLADMPPVGAVTTSSALAQQSGDLPSWGPPTPPTVNPAVRLPLDISNSLAASSSGSHVQPGHPHAGFPPTPFPDTSEIPPTTCHLASTSTQSSQARLYPPIHHSFGNVHTPSHVPATSTASMGTTHPLTGSPYAGVLDTASDQQHMMPGNTYPVLGAGSSGVVPDQPVQQLVQRPRPFADAGFNQPSVSSPVARNATQQLVPRPQPFSAAGYDQASLDSPVAQNATQQLVPRPQPVSAAGYDQASLDSPVAQNATQQLVPWLPPSIDPGYDHKAPTRASVPDDTARVSDQGPSSTRAQQKASDPAASQGQTPGVTPDRAPARARRGPQENGLPWMQLLCAKDQMALLNLLTGPQDVLQPPATVTAIVQLLHKNETTTEEVQRAALQLAVKWSRIDALSAYMKTQYVYKNTISLMMSRPALAELGREFINLVNTNGSGVETPRATSFSAAPYQHIMSLIPATQDQALETASEVAPALGALLLLSQQGKEVKQAFVNAQPDAALYFRLGDLVLNNDAPSAVRKLAAELVMDWFDCMKEDHDGVEVAEFVADLMSDPDWKELGDKLLDKIANQTGQEKHPATGQGAVQPGTTPPPAAEALARQLGQLTMQV